MSNDKQKIGSDDVKGYIADCPDYPKEGIIFKDIMPLLRQPAELKHAVKQMAEPYVDKNIDGVVSPEARGFIFGVPVSQYLNCGFIPVRKPGKLPGETASKSYGLEYGTDEIQIQKNAIVKGNRYLLVDDLLATGGTIEAAAQLVKELGGEIAGFSFLIELSFLDGRDKLTGFGADVYSLIKYDSE